MFEKNISMEFTGERFVPEAHGNIELEHLHRYLLACSIAPGKTILDIASGEGYGSAMLAKNADKVIGVDISVEAVNHARKRYKKDNLEYMVGSCIEIPLPDASVDVIVSFETIEHHDQHEQMMREFKRVLRPQGILLISSPDKYYYSVVPSYENPYHIKELYQHEFKQLLKTYFKNICCFGQRVMYGSVLCSESLPVPNSSFLLEEETIREASGMINPLYWIAIASDIQLPELASGVLEQPINDSEVVSSWNRLVAERDAHINSLNQNLAERDAHINSLNQNVVELKSALDCDSKEREEALSKLTRLAEERNVILSSISWRITSPIRGFKHRFPWMGRQIRRMAKLVWWTITGKVYSRLKEKLTNHRYNKNEMEFIVAKGLFDTDWYLAQNPDVAQSNINPVQHFIEFGWKEARDPNPFFDTDWYLAQNPDVAQSGVNPLQHYIEYGAKEGRDPNPFFDTDWYLAQNPDLAQANINPLQRYMEYVAEKSEEVYSVKNFHDHLRFSFTYPMQDLVPPLKPLGSSLDIHWVIPTFEKGSGGTTTILRFVYGLEKLGHHCHIWLDNRTQHSSIIPHEHYKRLIYEHFFPIKSSVRYLPKNINDINGDAIIATDRFTTYPVRSMSNFRRRFYFIQDREEAFYPVGAEYYITLMTYSFGFDALCASKWIKRSLEVDHKCWAMSWDLAVDNYIYNSDKRYLTDTKNRILRIACYSRYVTPRRCVELALLAFDILHMQNYKFHVDFFGWSDPGLNISYSHNWLGILSGIELANLYRSSDIGLVFSGTNYSLIPKEMMACGLPVVELNSPSIRMEFPDETIFTVDPDPLAIANKLAELISNPNHLNKVGKLGHEFAMKFRWEDSIKKVEQSIYERCLSGNSASTH